MAKSNNWKWAVLIVILLCLGIFSMLGALIIGVFVSAASDIEPVGNVAHISVTGPIMANSAGGFMSTSVASSTQIVQMIKRADENPEVEALLIEINSPGGTAVASYEIAEALLESNKTTVAWIREVGASGGYWIATGCDHIVANPMSITGSIGVIGSYIDWSGTLERYNASYQKLVSGDYKDTGTPFRSLRDDEEEMLQEKIDKLRDVFAMSVAKNRNLDYADVDKLADGRFYLGIEAKEHGLIDELGGYQDAIEYIEKSNGIKASVAKYERSKTFVEVLAGVSNINSFELGRGIGHELTPNTQSSPQIFT